MTALSRITDRKHAGVARGDLRFVTHTELRRKGIREGTLRALRRSGRVAHRKVGRSYHYREADVERELGFPEAEGAAAGQQRQLDPDVAEVLRRLSA